ncbi:MAG: right-handed parallel beta-helix repeat-containing protein, partial [Anaerolineae bacterium]
GSAGSLDHCDISRAGASESLAVQIQSSDVVLDHCTIHDNIGATGVALRLDGVGLTPTISNTTIRDNSGRALQQSTLDMTPAYTNLTFSGNGTDALVIGQGDLYRAVALDGQQLNGRPIISLDQINVWDQARLTLAPGTEIRLSTGDAVYVEPGGTLIAEGTAALPVTFSSVEPAAPFLKLHFLPGSTSRLAHCDVSHAGGSGFDALAVYSSDFAMSHCLVHDNVAWGMRLFQGAGSPVLDNMVFMDNGSGGLFAERDVDAILRHATFARNGGEGIRVRPGATATLTNTIVTGHETGVNVVAGGSATMAHTLWDGNTQDVAGEVSQTGHFEGSAAFAADGYHLTASSAALNLGAETGIADDIDGEPRPLPAGTQPDLGADETGATLQSWQKSIDGQPWWPGLSLSVETLDTVEVVDLVAAASDVPFTLAETWDPAHLSLSNYTLEPSGAGTVTTDTGRLTWEVTPGHSAAVTLTKLFAVQTCTWTATTLHETLGGLDIAETSRPVSFHKTQPDLWLEASHGYQVHPGEIATATLTYGNDGGKETDITVQADMAAGASLHDADPVPSWHVADGSAARWQVPALGMGERGQIGLSVAIAPDVLPPTTLVITSQIRDHTGRAAGAVNITYQVAEFPRHDVSIVDARPRGELPVGEPVDVTAELFNDGSETEAGVPVRCTIEGPANGLVYSETVHSGAVTAGTSTQVEFPAWTPAEAGSHILTCLGLLPSDEDPADDVYSHSLTATLGGVPDVWTRDNEADTGDVPSGHPWWVSPDIWVRNQPDGGLVHQNPIVDRENTVYVRLRNRGTRAASGQVGVYWSRSRVGWPCKLWSPNVGTIAFEDLAPGEVRIVRLAWVPQEPGRHGLHTVIDAEGDPTDWGAPCSPHRPRWDNNVSWRNTVGHFRPPKPARQLLAAEAVEVDLVNPYDWFKEVDLFVGRTTFPPTGTITIRLAEPLFDRWLAHEERWTQGIGVLTETKLLTVSGEVTATVGGIPLDAHEEVTATLLFDAPGEGIFEVALQERIDGLSVGGVSYQWLASDVVPPVVVAHAPADGATEVPLDAPVVVTFTEEIGPLTFEPIIAPALNEWSTSWNEAGIVFTVTLPAFAPATRYTATVKARDASANPLAAPYTWSFTSREGWDIYLPLVVRDG